MFGHLSEDAIEDVLHKQFIGRIGCNYNDLTYVVPIGYAYDGKYVYAHAEEGMKINMMRENPHVCFEVDTIENMGNWKSVIGWGDYEELSDEKERAFAVNILLNRGIPKGSSKTSYLTPDWPFHSKNTTDIEGIVFRIRLNIKTGRFERGDTVSPRLA